MKKMFVSGIVVMLFAACQPQNNAVQENASQTQPVAEENSQDYLMAATLFVQRAAEYQALCYQAYATATFRLQQSFKEVENPAVILDLDETVLDNSPYSGWQVMNNQPYSADTWAKWTDLAAAGEVPGAGAFLRFADSLGVTMFYVSNRDTAALEPTIRNMSDLNMPQLDHKHFLLMTNTSGKKERRQEVQDRGYNVVMLIGDNLGDFHEKWDKQEDNTRGVITENDRKKFGLEYIVLPNPIYGTWEGDIYEFNRSLNDAQRDSIRREVLKVAPIGGR